MSNLAKPTSTWPHDQWTKPYVFCHIDRVQDYTIHQSLAIDGWYVGDGPEQFQIISSWLKKMVRCPILWKTDQGWMDEWDKWMSNMNDDWNINNINTIRNCMQVTGENEPHATKTSRGAFASAGSLQELSLTIIIINNSNNNNNQQPTTNNQQPTTTTTTTEIDIVNISQIASDRRHITRNEIWSQESWQLHCQSAASYHHSQMRHCCYDG